MKKNLIGIDEAINEAIGKLLSVARELRKAGYNDKAKKIYDIIGLLENIGQ